MIRTTGRTQNMGKRFERLAQFHTPDSIVLQWSGLWSYAANVQIDCRLPIFAPSPYSPRLLMCRWFLQNWSRLSINASGTISGSRGNTTWWGQASVRWHHRVTGRLAPAPRMLGGSPQLTLESLSGIHATKGSQGTESSSLGMRSYRQGNHGHSLWRKLYQSGTINHDWTHWQTHKRCGRMWTNPSNSCASQLCPSFFTFSYPMAIHASICIGKGPWSSYRTSGGLYSLVIIWSVSGMYKE